MESGTEGYGVSGADARRPAEATVVPGGTARRYRMLGMGLAMTLLAVAGRAGADDGSPADQYRRGTTMVAVGIPMLSVGVATEWLIGFSPMVRSPEQYGMTYGGPLVGTIGAALALAGTEHQVAALRAVGVDAPRTGAGVGWVLFGLAIAAEMVVVGMDTLDEATAWPHYFWVGGMATALKAGALVAVSIQAGGNVRLYRDQVAPTPAGARPERRPTPAVAVVPAGAGLVVVGVF